MTSPVLFVHGLWLHASSWQPWQDFFAAEGYETSAPGWPGDPDTVEESRQQPERLAGHGIEEITDHYAVIIATMPERPILIGHSFGGVLVEKLLGQGLGVAAVAIDAAPFRGVLPLPISALRSAFPVLKNPANRERAVALTAEQFRYAFGNAISEEESNDLHQRWAIPGPGKPLFQAATANLNPHSEDRIDVDNPDRGPLLLIAGGKDHTVPEAITKASLKQYRHNPAVTDYTAFPDRGHSLTLDRGWREIAEASLAWLRKYGL
jgi:pimeloyl-ACP methyl ester carboxylesterase